ncbi:MAG TPA: hypothetical protein VF546_04050 [Pyrinomonadaceae bacterium]
MELNDDAKEIVEDLGRAINAAVERAPEVADAIARLREAGYELELSLKLVIGLRELNESDRQRAADVTLELTDEDRRTLRGMKIRYDEDE